MAIDEELLAKLKELDSETHRRYVEGVAMNTDCTLRPDIRPAWLQLVIQEAIAARDLSFRVGKNRAEIYLAFESHLGAEIYEEDISDARGDTPAEALLRAYLAAMED